MQSRCGSNWHVFDYLLVGKLKIISQSCFFTLYFLLLLKQLPPSFYLVSSLGQDITVHAWLSTVSLSTPVTHFTQQENCQRQSQFPLPTLSLLQLWQPLYDKFLDFFFFVVLQNEKLHREGLVLEPRKAGRRLEERAWAQMWRKQCNSRWAVLD